MDNSMDAYSLGKHRAMQNFVCNTYTQKWKRQLAKGEKPKWMTEKLFFMHNANQNKAPTQYDRGVLLTVSPGTDPGQEASTKLFLRELYEKLKTYKNFIPEEHTFAIETLKKDGITATHPHFHLAFPNVHCHSKTLMIKRVHSACHQIAKHNVGYYVPIFSRQSIDIANKASYPVYATYVRKNEGLAFGADAPEDPLRSE